MAGSACCNRDGFVVEFPNTFKVRVYDNSLNYTTHTVIRYATKYANVFVYKVLKTSNRVTVWVDSDTITARKEQNGTHLIIRRTLDTPIPNIVCGALTESHKWVVLDDSPKTVEMTLF